MGQYKINKDDVDTVIAYLKLHDPKNADEEYAVQLLYVMNELAKEVAHQDLDTEDLIQKAMDKLASS